MVSQLVVGRGIVVAGAPISTWALPVGLFEACVSKSSMQGRCLGVEAGREGRDGIFLTMHAALELVGGVD